MAEPATDVVAGVVAEAAELEIAFGNPFHDVPFGYRSIVDDDDASRVNPEAARILEAWGVSSELVPVSLGGRWASTSSLVSRLRPIFRRDPSVGYEIALGSLNAAVSIWIAGDENLKSTYSRLLRGNGSIVSGADWENESGGFRISASDGGWILSGSGAVLGDCRLGGAAVLHAVSETPDGDRANLVVWHPDSGLVGDRSTVERIEVAGLRGCRFSQLQVQGQPISRVVTMGHGTIDPDRGAGIVTEGVRQIEDALVPAVAIGVVDAALHLAYSYGTGRELYGGVVLDLPHARGLVADARTDLLIADALSAVAVRSLHLDPASTRALTAACGLLAPELLNDAMRSLSVLFGSTFYGRVEPFEIIEKFVRDLQAIPVLRLRADAQTQAIASRLGALPEPDGSFDARLFANDGQLAEPDFSRLMIDGDPKDPLGALLSSPLVRSALEDRRPELSAMIARFDERFRLLLETSRRTIESAGDDVDAPTRAREFSVIQGVGACLGVWYWSIMNDPDNDASDLDWLHAALIRLENRNTGTRASLPIGLAEAAVAKVASCVEEHRSIAFDRAPVCGMNPEETLNDRDNGEKTVL
jgi:alkylation response protein AidB-like acyl-CoA dehydrogenase